MEVTDDTAKAAEEILAQDPLLDGRVITKENGGSWSNHQSRYSRS